MHIMMLAKFSCRPACRHIHLYATLRRHAVMHLTAMYSGCYYAKPIFNYILNIPHKSTMYHNTAFEYSKEILEISSY